MFFSKKKEIIGLDIGSSSIKLVELQGGKKRLSAAESGPLYSATRGHCGWGPDGFGYDY